MPNLKLVKKHAWIIAIVLVGFFLRVGTSGPRTLTHARRYQRHEGGGNGKPGGFFHEVSLAQVLHQHFFLDVAHSDSPNTRRA